MIIVKAVLISLALFYVYAFCSIRLITQEFKPLIQFLQTFKNPWVFYVGTGIFTLVSPFVFVITVVTKVLWKITSFLMK